MDLLGKYYKIQLSADFCKGVPMNKYMSIISDYAEIISEIGNIN